MYLQAAQISLLGLQLAPELSHLLQKLLSGKDPLGQVDRDPLDPAGVLNRQDELGGASDLEGASFEVLEEVPVVIEVAPQFLRH